MVCAILRLQQSNAENFSTAALQTAKQINRLTTQRNPSLATQPVRDHGGRWREKKACTEDVYGKMLF